jgi:thiamine-phosphate pyrophosphorylase
VTLERVRVVVVTDPTCDDLVARVAAFARAVPAGSTLVQVRAKNRDGGALYELARAVIAAARPHGAPVWVNDRVDVALACGADGVHLPERGLSIEDARAIAPGLAIGASRHDEAGARAAAAAGAELVVLGPIWDTPSKRGVIAPLDPAALAVRGDLPARVRVVAIGGITDAERARAARAAGADAIAVVRAAWTSPDPGATIADLVAACG